MEMLHPARRARNQGLSSLVVFFGLLVVLPAADAKTFVRGNVNEDSRVDISDPIGILDFLFAGGGLLSCEKAADVDDNGVVEITDPISLLEFLFIGGGPPAAPYPVAGNDPTLDSLLCGSAGVTSIAATPSPLSLTGMGVTAQLLVTGDDGGNLVDLTAGSTGTTYASSDLRKALVYRDGKVEGVAAGSATITIRNGDLATTVTVNVGPGGPSSNYRVLAVNDLGMHCIDREFSVYSILPPFNVVNAQAVRLSATGFPTLLDDAAVDIRYSPVMDASGSINSRSAGKSDFWDHVAYDYGAALPAGQGLLGLYMPDDAPDAGPQPFAYDAGKGCFAAAGIPAIDKDDAGADRPYPLLRVSAFDKATGAFLASTDVVVPVSSETDCQNCHATGMIAASSSSVTWSDEADEEIQTKLNVLLIHDQKNGTDLYSKKHILCASCHYSPALDLAGAGPQGAQLEHGFFSHVMHGYHGERVDNEGNPVFPENGDAASTCYQCHPGAKTKCYRGAMASAGYECRHCHGGMLAVGGVHDLAPGGSLDGTRDGQRRLPWMDVPRCQSCHTGDAVTHLTGADLAFAPDGIRLAQAYRTGDPSSSAILATNKKYAENNNTLFRFSKGHGGILCENCHGSTHAEWPNGNPAANDNVAAMNLQGHSGKIVECKVCHTQGSLPMTLEGPHGMHNVGDARWTDHQHSGFYERNAARCRTCHGADYMGTVLSKTAAARTYQVEEGTVTVAKGTAIGCNRCHEWPKD
jgi:hypothetical protein